MAWANVPDQYVELIQSSASQVGMEPSLLAAVLANESGFNPNAQSSAGAEGIAQFEPSTAAGFGIDPWDPTQAIPAAAKYLSGLFNEFQNWNLAVAAYNAGPGAVEQYHGIPPYSETQNYVQNVDAAQQQYSYLDSGQTVAPASPSPAPGQATTSNMQTQTQNYPQAPTGWDAANPGNWIGYIWKYTQVWWGIHPVWLLLIALALLFLAYSLVKGGGDGTQTTNVSAASPGEKEKSIPKIVEDNPEVLAA